MTTESRIPPKNVPFFPTFFDYNVSKMFLTSAMCAVKTCVCIACLSVCLSVRERRAGESRPERDGQHSEAVITMESSCFANSYSGPRVCTGPFSSFRGPRCFFPIHLSKPHPGSEGTFPPISSRLVKPPVPGARPHPR